MVRRACAISKNYANGYAFCTAEKVGALLRNLALPKDRGTVLP